MLPALVACWSHCICVTHLQIDGQRVAAASTVVHLAMQPICPGALSAHIKAMLPAVPRRSIGLLQRGIHITLVGRGWCSTLHVL